MADGIPNLTPDELGTIFDALVRYRDDLAKIEDAGVMTDPIAGTIETLERLIDRIERIADAAAPSN